MVARKEMGYEAYQKLNKAAKLKVNNEISKQFGSWGKS